MRCKNIEFKITVPVDSPDSNGVKYAESAIVNAVNNFNPGVPFIRYNDNGVSQPIGFVNTLKYKNGKIIAKGFIFAGGFETTPTEMEGEIVTKMTFETMGFDKI